MAKKISQGSTKTYKVGRYTITRTKSKDAVSGKKTKTTNITKDVGRINDEPVFSRTKVKSPKYAVSYGQGSYGTIGRKKEKSTDYYLGGSENMRKAKLSDLYDDYSAGEKDRGVKAKVSVKKTVQRLPKTGRASIEENGNLIRVPNRSRVRNTARRVKTKETSINGTILKTRAK